MSRPLPGQLQGAIPESEASASANRPSIVRLMRDPDRELHHRPLDLKLIRRLLGYMRPYTAKRNWLMLCVVLRAIQLPLVAWSIGAAINGPITQRGNVVYAGLGVLAIAALTQLTFHFRYRLALEIGEAVIHDLRQEIFAHLQRMPMSFFQRTKTGRLISRMTSDCEAMRVGVQDVLFVGIVGLGQMIVAAMFMLYYDVVLFLVIALMSPILWWLNHHFRAKLSQAYREVQESFSRVTATLAESVAGIRVTQGFVRQEVNRQLFHELVTDHARFNMNAARTSGVLMPLLEFNSQFFIAALLLVGGYRVLNPEISMPIGDLIQFFFLANIFFSPIQILGNQFNQALTAMAGAERVFRLLDTQPEWSDASDAYPLPPIAGKVEFRDLTFGYDASRPVLQDVNLCCEAGQTIALVGHTGSGKTTLINLLARFYLPTKGHVLIDGHDTRQIQGSTLQNQMGIVLQHNFLFTGTVLDNIRVGMPSATDDQVLAAIQSLDCLDLLQALPDGLKTEVGERGGRVSLGQRQIICFARAMLANPRILILDEATSAVDTLTEARVQHALGKLVANRTSFIVAHRLSTIRKADKVVVIDGGRILESGTHTELVARGGKYAELVDHFTRGKAGSAAVTDRT